MAIVPRSSIFKAMNIGIQTQMYTNIQKHYSLHPYIYMYMGSTTDRYSTIVLHLYP